jgi:hypothetical protein
LLWEAARIDPAVSKAARVAISVPEANFAGWLMRGAAVIKDLFFAGVCLPYV